MLGASTAMGMEIPLSRSTTADMEKPEPEPEPEICGFDDESEGLTAKQKSALGFIWFVAGIYSIMSDHILSKGHTKTQKSLTQTESPTSFQCFQFSLLRSENWLQFS